MLICELLKLVHVVVWIVECFVSHNQFPTNIPTFYPLKTPENLKTFSGVIFVVQFSGTLLDNVHCKKMKFSIKGFFSNCDQILNWKLHFLCSSISLVNIIFFVNFHYFCVFMSQVKVPHLTHLAQVVLHRM